VPRDAHRDRWAIEVAAVGDGAVRVDVSGLMDAHERAARRWSRLRLAGAILCSLAVSGSLVLGVMALRWDVQQRRDMQVLKFLLQETEARGMCWRAVAIRWNRAPEDIVKVDGREAWVRGCVERELARQEGSPLRSARERAVKKAEKVNHDQAVQRGYGP
jgi:hypothetical protein